ncbi:GIY-YIG nuclease family protein [Rhodobacteraceae bacterium D3-12]|nr:GIY-YIG nuclease family protein [Rhodobacteraceae bacterium D3-12]
MALIDDIFELIKQRPGISDAGLTHALPGGPSRHQQINARCRKLVAEGLISRDKQPGLAIQNFPTEKVHAALPTEGSARPRVGEKRPPRGADGRCPAVPPGKPVPATVAAQEPTATKPAPSGVSHIKITTALLWHSGGEVALDGLEKLLFPILKPIAGIYRFRFPHRRSVYVGETTNLRRRMQNYRTPGATQSTSIWVNKLIRECLVDNEIVLLDTSTDISVSLNDASKHDVLHSKTIRLLAENAALFAETEAGWTTLNKAT